MAKRSGLRPGVPGATPTQCELELVVTPSREGGSNVYAGLGYPDAEQMLVKAKLVRMISGIIRSKGLTQLEIASILGLDQPKASALLRGQFREISERQLIDGLTSLRCDAPWLGSQTKSSP